MPIALLQAAILAVFLHSMAAAEGPIYAVQDALKREQFYFGERTGVLDPPTRSALRLFQTRHGLPDTGEIDSSTLQALQSSTDVGRPVIGSRSPATKEAAPSEAIVEKDREFLRNLEAVETGRERKMASPSELSGSSVPPPTTVPDPEPVQAPGAVQSLQPAANPAPALVPEIEPSPSADQPTVATPSAPDAVAQPSRKAEVRRPEVAKSRLVEKPRSLARRKVEEPTRAQSSASPRRVEPRIPPANSRVVEIDDEPEPLDSGGVRIIRPTTTTTTGPDGRTYTKTTTHPATVAPTIRRAEPVEPRRKSDGFFDRLFKDD